MIRSRGGVTWVGHVVGHVVGLVQVDRRSNSSGIWKKTVHLYKCIDRAAHPIFF